MYVVAVNGSGAAKWFWHALCSKEVCPGDVKNGFIQPKIREEEVCRIYEVIHRNELKDPPIPGFS